MTMTGLAQFAPDFAIEFSLPDGPAAQVLKNAAPRELAATPRSTSPKWLMSRVNPLLAAGIIGIGGNPVPLPTGVDEPLAPDGGVGADVAPPGTALSPRNERECGGLRSDFFPCTVLGLDELLREVVGWHFGDLSTVTVHVCRLLETVEHNSTHPVRLINILGVGCRWEPVQ